MSTGSKTNAMSRKQALQAVRDLPREKDFVRDGVDEDERPATEEELLESLEAQRRKRGRPSGSGTRSRWPCASTGTYWPRSAPAAQAGKRA